MRYGLTLPNGGTCGDICLLTELGCLAEATGWDGVFLEDYIVHQGAGPTPTCDPWMALAAMAVQTSRVRLGTSVTPLSRRRPWKVAREAVALDHLSHGRFILGVGLGDENEAGFGHVGEILDARQRAKRLDEALEIVTGLWSGKPFAYQGEHFRLDTVTFLPTPLQQPRIPIWVGGGWPRMGPALRAARYDGCLLFSTKQPSWTPEEARALKAFLERHRTDPTPYDLVFSPPPDEDRRTLRALAEAGMTWCIEYLPAGSPDHMRARIARGPQRIE